MPETLAQRVRTKYPGAYDDLNDQQLESAITTKFPGVYDDIPRAAAPPTRNPIVDAGIGAVKGVGNTAVGLGEMVHMIPGVSRAVDAMYGAPVSEQGFTNARQAMAPTNTAQRVGFGAEQIGEFFLPTGPAGKALQAGKSGLLTLAQTGSPLTAGVSAGLTSVLPGAGAAQRASTSLREGAEKTMAQALGPTKEWAKDTARKVAPEMLKRGVGGSRAAMLEQASQQTRSVGASIGAEIQRAAQAGQTINGGAVRDAILNAANGLHVGTANGGAIPIAGTEQVVKRLAKLDAFVAKLGDDIPIDKAAKVKTTFDQIVSKAGLYGQKGGASATDSANAWAIREAAGAFRGLLAKANPTLDDLNAEYAFWKGLKGVLTETEKRTQAQSGGLTAAITGSAGIGAGLASGDSVGDKVQNAVFGGLAGRQLVRAMQSPQWRTQVSAPMKEVLAKALAAGRAEAVTAAVARITSAMPAQLRNAAVMP